MNKCILVGLQRLGALEKQLPLALEGSVVQHVYICKGCFSEVDKYIKLQADVELVAGSIRSKLRAQGLSIADSGPSIDGQVAIEGSSVRSTNSCMILGSTNTHVYANKCPLSYIYVCSQASWFARDSMHTKTPVTRPGPINQEPFN